MCQDLLRQWEALRAKLPAAAKADAPPSTKPASASASAAARPTTAANTSASLPSASAASASALEIKSESAAIKTNSKSDALPSAPKVGVPDVKTPQPAPSKVESGAGEGMSGDDSEDSDEPAARKTDTESEGESDDEGARYARGYQRELFERAKLQNMIAFLPTGSGKTVHLHCGFFLSSYLLAD